MVAAGGETTGEIETDISVDLVHARWRHAMWAAGWITLGIVLASRFGDIGLYLGCVFVYFGLTSVWEVLKTMRHAPGRIVVDDEGMTMATALCSGHEVKLAHDDVENAYLLRRALPMNTTGPLLVVETKKGVFEFPRDWFLEGGDQKRIVLAVNRRKGHV